MEEKKIISQLSGKEIPLNEAVRGSTIHSPLIDDIRKQCPGFDENGYVSLEELNKIRDEHIKRLIAEDRGELSRIENEVLQSILKAEIMSEYEENKEKLSFGDRLADRIAEFGGSWRFIIIFMLFLVVWICVNVFVWVSRPFDPYPFILLNLILSCIAALQAPVIMMSQNRMEAKDRERARNDYKVNLKAEIEIRQLHEKMDHLIMKQMQHLNEIQQIQIDLLNEITQRTKRE